MESGLVFLCTVVAGIGTTLLLIAEARFSFRKFKSRHRGVFRAAYAVTFLAFGMSLVSLFSI